MEEKIVERMDARLQSLQKEHEGLQQELEGLKDKKESLKRELEQDRATLRARKAEALDVKMHRIAMEEIARCSWESLLRTMGYVKSFHGYPDMANAEKKETEAEEKEGSDANHENP